MLNSQCGQYKEPEVKEDEWDTAEKKEENEEEGEGMRRRGRRGRGLKG